ncbi:MAG: hypothetical protein ACREN4_06240, partial [Candidatus Dormibacteria bacterium]
MAALKRAPLRAKSRPSARIEVGPPGPLWATPGGELQPGAPGWQALGASAHEPRPLVRWMRVPQGTTLMHLPGSRGLGLDPRGRLGDLPGMAVAAVLPVGFLRLLLPAYRPESQGDQRTLPLYGYTAVAESG